MMYFFNKKILNVKLYIYLLFALSAYIFISFPQIDLFIASLFYNGKSFAANGTPLEQFFYHSVRPLIIFMLISTFLVFFYNLFFKTNYFNLHAKQLLFIILVLGLAPGLLVNVILKEHWGRPRPSQVQEFGGKLHFTPAYIRSHQEGYSFSSGHTAAAFSLLGFALLARGRKKFWISLVLLYGASVSLARMAAGGHFFSDVVTSFFIVWISTHILYKLIFKKDSDAT